MRQRQRRGQAMTEYAIVVLLIIAAVVAMQTFVKRRHQALTEGVAGQYIGALVTGAIKDVSPNGVPTFNMLAQYEPYYLNQNVNVGSSGSSSTNIGKGWTTATVSSETTVRTGSMSTGTNVKADQGWRQ